LEAEMSLRDTLAAEVERLAAEHAKLSVAYRDARATRLTADAKVRLASAAAGAAWNDLAAARSALNELDKQSARSVSGAGNLEATR
jgi:hypothetical protein